MFILRKITKICSKNSSKGYSLVELSIVILVGSFLSILVYYSLINPSENDRYLNTVKKMDRIEEKLLKYLSENGRIPCPARPFADRNTFEYGVEAIEFANNLGPSTCAVEDGIKALTSDLTAIYQGSVPVTTLDLDGDLIADEYGNQFSYVVTRSYANNASTNQLCLPSFRQPNGMLTSDDICFASERGAVDMHNNTIKLYGVYQPDTESGNLIQGVAYILISYGKNGGGALPRYAMSDSQRMTIDSDTSKATFLNLGCSASGTCNLNDLENNGEYVLNAALESGKNNTNIVRFGARNNMVIRCQQKFDRKCSNDWSLDVR